MSGAGGERRRWRRVFLTAFGLFMVSLIAPPGRSQPPAAPDANIDANTLPPTPTLPPKREKEAKKAAPPEIAAVLQATAADMPAATTEEKRQWAGALAALGQPSAAKRLAGPPPKPAELAALLATLIRRGQAEHALPLLEQRRADPPKDAAWLKAAAHWQLGEMALVPRDLADAPPADRSAAALVSQLAGPLARGQRINLEQHPWIAKGKHPPGTLPPVDPASIPADAAASLAKWLRFQPNDGGAWALLALVALEKGAENDALDCLLRAEARNQGSAVLQRLKADLQRQQADRNRAALDALDEPPPVAPPAPPAAEFDPRSVRALAGIGGGGLLVGLLIGLQLRGWLGRRKA